MVLQEFEDLSLLALFLSVGIFMGPTSDLIIAPDPFFYHLKLSRQFDKTSQHFELALSRYPN